MVDRVTSVSTGGSQVLAPALVHRLGRLRLRLRRRVDGRFVGGHPARGYGSSQDFADYREYVAGDDPRLLDPHAYVRHGRLLVRLYAAEDTAAVTIVVDQSKSMAFAGKADVARQIAAALATVVLSGGDRARVVLAGSISDPGPWYAGGSGLAAMLTRLSNAPPADGRGDLLQALDRARRRGPRGPLLVVSDLLTGEWPQVLARLGADRGDALLVHLLARNEIDPDITGDVRLVDVETATEVELAVTAGTLARYRATRDAWFDAVERTCGARSVGLARHVSDQPVERLVSVDLRRLGWVA